MPAVIIGALWEFEICPTDVRRLVGGALGSYLWYRAHFTGDEAKPRVIAELEAAVEQNLHANAQPDHWAARRNEFEHRGFEPASQKRFHAITEGANARQYQSVRCRDPLWPASHFGFGTTRL